ncbi:MAG: hypothetical protein AAF899_18015 [Pseudomonadota bacterium]
MIRTAIALALAASGMSVTTAHAEPLCDDFGTAGLLAACNRGDDIELTLSSGEPLHDGQVTLSSGVYYEMIITSDGSAELALAGPGFFRAIWMDEIVINDLEVRPMAVDSFEFDDEGELELSFIAVKPGTYELRIPGTTGETTGVKIVIE